MANPRKFSEKIALHHQKQAEETAAFERIMNECSATKVMGAPQPRNVTHLQPHAFLRPYLSGSLPNVNQIAAHPQMELHHQAMLDDNKHTMRHPARLDSRMRPYAYAHRRHPMPLERNKMSHIDGPPGHYQNTFLSPPHESNWRSFALSRTNSDSALHQSVMHPNNQDAFNANNSMHNQVRREAHEENLNSMNPSYKALMERKKFDQQFQNANRPKSCEAPNVSLLPTGEAPSAMQTIADGFPMPMGGGRTVSHTDPSALSHGLTHVTQMGTNTGSLPNLPALFNHPAAANPRDYNDQHPSSRPVPLPNPPKYHQAQSTNNLPAASGMSPHFGALSRNPASPGRPRRTTLNGPSPLIISSPEHPRRMKFPSATSPNVTGIKPEMKSPPIGGPYVNPYTPHSGSPGGWPLSTDHPGSPSQTQSMSPLAITQNSTPSAHQQHVSPQAGGNLRIDVSAASKVNQQPPAYHRGRSVTTVTSPLTSPTSPTSHCSHLSPVTSPRTDFNNPPHAESFYRPDTMQPLQHQFEHFHVVGDSGNPHQYVGGSPMYGGGMLSSVNEGSMDDVYDRGHCAAAGTNQNVTGLHSAPAKLGQSTNHGNKIPDIILTGADEQHAMKSGGLFDFGAAAMMGHELDSSDYFPTADLKANFGIEELRMLEETNVLSDPAIDDALNNL